MEIHLHAILRDEGLVFHDTPLVDAELKHIAQEIRLGDDLSQDIRLLDRVDFGYFGQARGVVHLEHVALRRGDAVRDVGHGGDHVHVELAVEPLLDDLHVQ